MNKFLILTTFFLGLLSFFSYPISAQTCSKDRQPCSSDLQCHDGTSNCNGYYCRITSGGRGGVTGTCEYSAAQRQSQTPNTPTDLSVTKEEDTKIAVKWINQQNTETYQIWYKKANDTNYQKKEVVATFGYHGQVTIEGLQPEADYSIYIAACNAAGCSPGSQTVSAKTTFASTCGRQGASCGSATGNTCCTGYNCFYSDPSGIIGSCQATFVPRNNEPLPNPPVNLKATFIGEGRIDLTWDLIPNAERYSVWYEKKVQPGLQKKGGDHPPASITGLEPNTEYLISVEGCNTGGCSGRSSAISFITTSSRSTSFSISPPPPTPIPPAPPCSKGLDISGNETTNQKAIVKCIEVDTGLGPISADPIRFVKSIFSIILSLSGGIALLLIILSGYKLMLSQGNPEKTQEAKETLTAAIVGLLFIIFSLVILQVIGVDILRIPGFGK